MGWSLGGVVVREVARRRPALVRTVVTFGSPIVGGIGHTAVARMGSGGQRAGAGERLERYVAARDRRQPLRMPVTVLLSRRDGVVSWQSCWDHHSPRAEHVEVRSSHLGMVLDPDVWTSVAQGLARR